MTFRAKAVALLAGLSFIFMASAATAQQTAAPSPGAQLALSVGFAIRGVIHSGSTKLPGVSITASHSLTGRKVITSTDVDGSFRLDLPSRGRWVLRAELSAFAVQTAELVLTPEQPEATHDFEMILLSRVPKEANPGGDELNGQQMLTHSPAGAGRGAQQLTVNADDAALAQSAISGEGDLSSANVSGLAASADATNQSVSVSGRMGNAQDFGLQNMDDLRERIQEMRARGQLGDSGFGLAGGGSGGNGVFIMGGPGGGGGGRMRIGSMTRPHGQIYYNASNSVLDASPYALSGRTQKPAYGSNRFGGMLGGPLKIPHVYDDGGKTFMFLNYSGTRGSTPYDVFSHVPTLLERGGNFSETQVNGVPVQLFDPTHPGTALAGNVVPISLKSPQAAALLNYIPSPNVFDGSPQNFHFSSAAQSDSDTFALRFTHNFGAPRQRGTPGMPGAGGGRGGGGRPRNNLSFGLNYQRNESDTREPFPLVFGNTHTNGFNTNVGWALSKGKWSNQLRFIWNRSRSHGNSHFAGESNVAAGALDAGGAGMGYPSFVDPAQNPIIWGLPGLGFSHYTSLGDVAPSQRDSRTFTLSENIGWVRGKHHLHFGGDYRWIDNKAFASLNPRGAFTFTGSSSAAYAIDPSTGLPAPVAGTGYDFADFLLGYAQQTTLAYSQVRDQYLANSYDLFVQDDWRVRGNLTVNFGLRYEFISPFNESHDQLENLITHFDAASNFTGATVVSPNQAGQPYPRALVHPDRNNFAPRVGIAWKPFGTKTVVRAGYGINYNLAQYASIVHSLAAHPPCADTSTPCAVTQTNGNTSPTGPSPFTLANGFSAQSSIITNNYGIDPHYRVAYVQLWTLNVQHEITPTLLLNVGYTGSKGSALDMLRAPNRGPGGAIVATVDPFNWETSQGSSILHAGSVRLRKRMTNGVAIGGTYTYSKSIDNASSIGGGTQVVAQDDKNLRAERGLSSFDQRHKLTGDWTLELPWGENRKWLTRPGIAQKVLGDWLLQSSFTIASGTPYTARVLGSFSNVAGGTNGTLRADYNGAPIQIGDRNLKHWFNTAAFSVPVPGTYGNAGRNTIIAPGTWLMNLVLSKNFPLKDSMGIEMRAEADNVLNHPNYSGIDSVVNSPTFGQVTSVSSMRKMILSMRYRF